jgi:hypothetical protein
MIEKIEKLDKWDHNKLHYRFNFNIAEYRAWKYAYDIAWSEHYTGKKIPPPEIWIETTSNRCLVVQYIDSPDDGIIPIHALDGVLPSWYNDHIFSDDNRDFIQGCGFEVVERGRLDAVIDLEKYKDFEEYKFSISSRLTRYWNKCETFFVLKQYTDDFGNFYLRHNQDNFTYWEDKGARAQPILGPDYFIGVEYDGLLTPLCFSVLTKEGNKSIATIWGYVRERRHRTDVKEVIWANTFYDQDYRKLGIGNYALLKMIESMFSLKVYRFNLGITFPDTVKDNPLSYKNKWGTTHVEFVKGIRKI